MRATPEADWLLPTSPLRSVRKIALDALVPRTRRLVVVAPHPDDETLCAGGLLAMLPAGRALLVCVTDGEASHGHADAMSRKTLAQRRTAEQNAAFGVLGHDVRASVRLGIGDGEVAGSEARLAADLERIVSADDIVITTPPFDGHPDHDACGRVCARIAQSARCQLWFAPVWLWHWQSPRSALPIDRFRRLPISARALRAKASALECFRTQLDADPRVPATPIVPPKALAHFKRSFETFVAAA